MGNCDWNIGCGCNCLDCKGIKIKDFMKGKKRCYNCKKIILKKEKFRELQVKTPQTTYKSWMRHCEKCYLIYK